MSYSEQYPEETGRVIPQREVISYGRFETTYRFHLLGSRFVTAEDGEGSFHDVRLGVQGYGTEDKSREGTSFFTQWRTEGGGFGGSSC